MNAQWRVFEIWSDPMTHQNTFNAPDPNSQTVTAAREKAEVGNKHVAN